MDYLIGALAALMLVLVAAGIMVMRGSISSRGRG